MSSLSATQADGYYVPPAYFTSGQYKKKSRNQFAGSKGHNQYLQNGTVRFELPYDGFCDKCGTQVGKGTRFNAKKTKVGAYFTSTIYEFQTNCRICSDSVFVIRTNPPKQSFDYVSGIHMRAHERDFIEGENKKESRVSGEHQKKSKLSQIETTAGGKRKALTEHDALQALIKINGETFGEDVSCNRNIRSSFRQDRREKKARLKGAASLGWKEGMELLREEREEDIVRAKSTIFSNGKKKESEKFRKLRTSSIFSSKVKQKSTAKQLSTPNEVASQDDVACYPELLEPDSSSSKSNARTPKKEKKKLVLSNSGNRGKISVVSTPSSFTFDLLSGYGTESE